MQKFLKTLLGCLALGTTLLAPAHGGERPTLQHTCDPRPDILPYYLYYAHTEYRRKYNRPSYLGGWLSYKLSRTSQEAMVWEENLQAGNYVGKHQPPMYKRYFAPKPWEVLQTGARPDFAKPSTQLTSGSQQRQYQRDTTIDEATITEEATVTEVEALNLNDQP